jgi:hypothetical protein
MFSTANHKLLLQILGIWKSCTKDIKVKYFTVCCACQLGKIASFVLSMPRDLVSDFFLPVPSFCVMVSQNQMLI